MISAEWYVLLQSFSDYQIKFDSDETYGDFVIKVKWGEKPEGIEDFEEDLKQDLKEDLKEDEDNPFEF